MADLETLCAVNASGGNGSGGAPLRLDYGLADTYLVVTGCIIFCGTLPMVLFEFRFFPLGSTAAVMLGAVLMVVFRVLGQAEVYDVIGRREHLAALFLVLGVMVLAQYFDRELILVRLLRKLFKPSLRFENYLLRVCVLSSLLSALFTSDACCVVLVPLLLKVWEVQERPRPELDVLLLGIATSANIGSVVSIFGSLQMALIAAKTGAAEFSASRLSLQHCIMYLLPAALLAFFLNLAFLVLHYRLRLARLHSSKLLSESCLSQQEVSGLTAGGGNNHGHGGHHNGFVKARDEGDLLYEGVYEGPAAVLAANLRDDRGLVPCQLETIPEDEVLEIDSSRSSSLRDSGDVHSPGSLRDGGDVHSPGSPQKRDVHSPGSPQKRGGGHGTVVSSMTYAVDPDIIEHLESDSSGSSDEGDVESRRPRDIGENLQRLNIEYRPSVLQSRSQNLMASLSGSATSLSKLLDHHGLPLLPKVGVFRSLSAFSLVDLLPLDAGYERLALGGGGAGANEALSPSAFGPTDSTPFLGVLAFLWGANIVFFLASTPTVSFDIGLVSMAMAVLAVIADAMLNHRPALVMFRRLDWSVLLLYFGLFVFLGGFLKTRLARCIVDRLGLAGSDFRDPVHVVLAFVLVLAAGGLLGGVPVTLVVLDLLEPCRDQLALVLLLAWTTALANNLTLYSSAPCLLVAQRASRILRVKVTFWGHLQYCLLSTLVISVIGLVVICGLLRV